MSHVPNPGDFNAPGDQNDPEAIKAASEGPSEELPPAKRPLTPEELGEALRRHEADGAAGADPFKGGPIPERPRPPQAPQEVPQDPRQASPEAIAQMRREVADPFQPIKELGREHSATFHIVVPDARPHVTVPLTGPGAYEITVKRRQ